MQFDDDEYQVVALAGTSVRLRSAVGSEAVVLLPFLLGSPGFAVVDGEPSPELEPFGLLDGLPEEVIAAAKEWEGNLVEMATGLTPEAGSGAVPRPEYDPQAWTVKERAAAKAAELGVGLRTWRGASCPYRPVGWPNESTTSRWRSLEPHPTPVIRKQERSP